MIKISNLREFVAFWLQYLESGRASDYTLDQHQLHGYLVGVLWGPGVALEENWLPLVFGVEPISLSTVGPDERDAVLRLAEMVRLQTAPLEFPMECAFDENPPMRLDCQQWARGFMQGYIFWQKIWSEISDETQTNEYLAAILQLGVLDEIDDILASISAIADAEYAQILGKTVEDLYSLHASLPEIVVSYRRVCLNIREIYQPANIISLH